MVAVAPCEVTIGTAVSDEATVVVVVPPLGVRT